tara:strand:- start:3880 stop:4527 length:648 start_codon:yes stop_codon:yes gene_type:complete
MSISGLYAITDHRLISEDKWQASIRACLEGGVRIIQYRDKSDDHQRRYYQAKIVTELCQQYSALSIINDDVELAAKVGASGVHLGQQDGSIVKARQRLGNQAIIGATCHSQVSLAWEAKNQGASYIAFGRFFPSKTKPEAPLATMDILSQAKEVALPIVAIGGINSDNMSALKSSTPDSSLPSAIAVVDAIFGQSDVFLATQRLVAQWHSLTLED